MTAKRSEVPRRPRLAARFGEHFVALWTLAVIATAAAFVLYLALRGRAIELGYKLGRVRARQAQLRETRRVLQLEAVAYRNPERIEKLARGVLQMEEPPPQRTFVLGAVTEGAASSAKPTPSTSIAPVVDDGPPIISVGPRPSASVRPGPARSP